MANLIDFNIKVGDVFYCTSKSNDTKYRACVEEQGVVFVYAHKAHRYGWRWTEEDFLHKYTPQKKHNKTILWKNRLKKTLKELQQYDLWPNLQELYKTAIEKIPTFEELEQVRQKNCQWLDEEDFDKEKESRNEYYERKNKEFLDWCQSKFPFMIKTREDNTRFVSYDYLGSEILCQRKTMYFGKSDNTRFKREIAQAMDNKEKYTCFARVQYDNSFEYNPKVKRAWYSEEFKNCGNGHYYLAVSPTTAIYSEDD